MSVAGSLYGLAYGDALGAPTEFRTVAEIVAVFGPGGPRDLPTEPGTGIARATDDTQMALANGTPWRDATIIGSKGCGANMRVTPIALPTGLADADRAGAAQLQAAL